MAKNYLLSFGSSNYSGLAPSFLVFNTMAGASTARPGITEIPTATGLYYFTYGPTNAIAFVVSGMTTSIPFGERYVSGLLDPIQAVDEQLTAVGTSILAQGSSILAGLIGISGLNTIIGTTASSYGDTSTMPATIFGYLKRLKEFNEGISDFTKSTGVWNVFASGTSTQLFTRTMSDLSGTVSKS